LVSAEYKMTQCIITSTGWSDQLHAWGLTWGVSNNGGAQNGCHGNASCLAMGWGNLRLTAAYFKNTKVN